MKPAADQKPEITYSLEVSAYDRAAGLLVSLLVILGAIVLMMLIAWLGSKAFIARAPIPVEMVKIGEGADPLGNTMDLDVPTQEEIQVETDLDQPVFEDTLLTVTDAVGAVALSLDNPAFGRPDGVVGGLGGDGRTPGEGGGVPRDWRVLFKGNTLKEYARQLDYFDIELGVLMPDNKLTYVSDLSEEKACIRTGSTDSEDRYYLTWRGGELEEADRELLAKAGVNAKGRIVVKFLPPQLEAELAAMEKAHDNKQPEDIRQTQFGVAEEDGEYLFYVIQQKYR